MTETNALIARNGGSNIWEGIVLDSGGEEAGKVLREYYNIEVRLAALMDYAFVNKQSLTRLGQGPWNSVWRDSTDQDTKWAAGIHDLSEAHPYFDFVHYFAPGDKQWSVETPGTGRHQPDDGW